MLPLALLDCPHMSADGTWVLKTITKDAARDLIIGRELISTIGHSTTAEAFSLLLTRPVAVTHKNLVMQVGQNALVLTLKGLLPEGTMLDADQLCEIGYELKLLVRTH